MQGDAFTSFYKNYYRLILTVAQQCFRGSTETEEVTAEVVRIVWQHCSEGHEPLPSWTYRARGASLRSERKACLAQRDRKRISSHSRLSVTRDSTSPSQSNGSSPTNFIRSSP